MTDPKSKLELFAETLPLTLADIGSGQPLLLLHGGAGPASMLGLANALAERYRVILPTHPGFNGEPRPERIGRIDDLALAYLAVIERLDLRDVVIVGNSVGGWIAAEMALRQSPRIKGIVPINMAGIETDSPELTVVDPTAVPPAERAKLAFHDPQKFAIAPTTPEGIAAMLENQKALRVYTGETLTDPTLRPRLAQIRVPTLVLWGASDRIVSVDYGRVFAASIPNARFETVAEAGHFPQIERLDAVVECIDGFVRAL